MKKLIPTLLAMTFATGAVVGGLVAAIVLDALGQELKEGDYVQWEAGGKYMFPVPRRIRKIEQSEQGTFVFVEGSDTGIPAAEVRKIDQPIWNKLRERIASVN